MAPYASTDSTTTTPANDYGATTGTATNTTPMATQRRPRCDDGCRNAIVARVWLRRSPASRRPSPGHAATTTMMTNRRRLLPSRTRQQVQRRLMGDGRHGAKGSHPLATTSHLQWPPQRWIIPQGPLAGYLDILSQGQQIPVSDDFESLPSRINKIAAAIVELDGPAGEKAWSDSVTVPMVFGRLRASLLLPPAPAAKEGPTIDEVSDALDAMLLGQGAGGERAKNNDDTGTQEAGRGEAQPSLNGPAHDNAIGQANATTGLNSGPTNEEEAQPKESDLHVNGGDGIDALFCMPARAELGPRPEKRQRQRRLFNMTEVRRSARLAGRPVIPALEMAKRNLCRKLGIEADEPTP